MLEGCLEGSLAAQLQGSVVYKGYWKAIIRVGWLVGCYLARLAPLSLAVLFAWYTTIVSERTYQCVNEEFRHLYSLIWLYIHPTARERLVPTPIGEVDKQSVVVHFRVYWGGGAWLGSTDSTTMWHTGWWALHPTSNITPLKV